MYQYALSRLHLRSAMQELVRGHPAQDQRGSLRRVDSPGDRGQATRLEREIGGIRSEDRYVRHAVTKLKLIHANAELINLPDDIVAHHKRRAARRGLRVEMAPDQRVGVLNAGGQYPDPYLAGTSHRQRSVDY